MSNSLLPPSASSFLRYAETPVVRISDIPVDLKTLWNPDTCPAPLLPYLAWALSVDRWDRNWSEATKRSVIKASYMVHRKKGTIRALRRVVEPFGFLIEVTEWWQSDEEPGTFRLNIGVNDQGISDDTYTELERLISDAKPLSRHLVGLTISMQTSGTCHVAAAGYDGDIITVYPWTSQQVETNGESFAGGAIQMIDSVSVYSL